MRRALARFRYRRLKRRLLGPRLLRALADARPDAFFVEIGANDGVEEDHLRRIIVSGRWSGIMVEPVPHIFARLEANYAGIERVSFENVAIAEADGRLPFFHLRQATPEERSGLPSWYDGIGSFSRDAVLSHARHIPDIADRLVETEVPVLTLDSLLERHGTPAVDVLVIDTEGHDAEVIAAIDLTRHHPQLLVYEHFHLPTEVQSRTRARLARLGYATAEEGFDTWCIGPDADPALARVFQGGRPAVPGLYARDEPDAPRAPELALHDDRTPLPEGAEDVLRPDNPRLEGLRRAYAASGLPAVAHSRWSPRRVEAFLDLCHFRGETLFLWHYRAEPRVTELEYFVRTMYVASRDRGGLLERLGEDGAFGCFTFSFQGHAPVSRDLLDSVLELSFLDEELPGWEGLRILDIGAGYGRLAHRTTEAHPGVVRYVCTDAVPESTFLSEYYLGYRGCERAEVVPLTGVPELAPGSFDLAVNVHSFPECTEAAVAWWLDQLVRLEVPLLFLVPNDGDEFLTLEADGSRRDFAPLLERAGYWLRARRAMVDDTAVAEMLRASDVLHLFARGEPPT